MSLNQTEDQNFILLDQVRVRVVSTVFDLASRLSLRDQTLQLFFVELQELLVEQDLLGDHPEAELLRDEDLGLLAN